jgi:hypothetical protein
MQKPSLIPAGNLRVGGVFNGQIVRDGKVIDEFDCPNLVANEGLDSLLDVYLGSDAAIPDVVPRPVPRQLHPGGDHHCRGDRSRPRPSVWTTTRPTASLRHRPAQTSQAVTNAANSGNLHVQRDAHDLRRVPRLLQRQERHRRCILFSAARFGTAKNVVDDDQLLLTYSFSASSA